LREHFDVREGKVKDSSQPGIAVSPDRPYLVAASGNPAFRPAFDLLSRICIYNINPAVIRDLQLTDSGDMLHREGRNLAAVLRRLTRDHRDRMRRIQDYMELIVPGIAGIQAKPLQNREMIEFRQSMPGAKSPWRFPASSMSDGTLRALGVLTAIFQAPPTGAMDLPIVGIEEPEVAVHPHALSVLLDALMEASESRQTVVTSHSPELLDRSTVDADSLLAVSSQAGATVIAPVDQAMREAMREHLCTAGELMRQNRLVPDPEEVTAVAEGGQLKLFDPLEP
jgi:predicted ATPase